MHRAILILLGAFVVGASAQQQETENEENFDRYQVEVILFAYRQPTPEGEDLSAWQRPQQTEPQALVELNDTGIATEAAAPKPVMDLGFEAVPRSELALVAEAERLAGISAYRVLAHGAWQQLGVGRDDAQPFPVSRLRVSGGVSGSLTLHVRRFPHLALELELPPAAGAGIGSPMSLKESRRLRRGELHYFDHPAFGAVVQVSRVELEQEEG